LGRDKLVSDDFKDRMIAFLPRLRRFTYALTGDFASADDLAQDACVRALTHRDQWQPGTKFESWMFRIAQNLWIDRRRTAKSRGVHQDIDDMVEPMGVDGRDVTDQRLTLVAVAKAMQSLSEDQRALLALVCIDGASYKEAAETLNLPIGTVMSRLARARQALHGILMPDGVDVSFAKESRRG
jgi:RNA polymerase sigma-70 factor, ECF subfamily